MGLFLKNERVVKEGYETKMPIYSWFKGLLRWLFLLNFFIGLANLLLIFITDGARMLQTFMSKMIKDQKKAIKVWYVINAGFAFMLIIGLFATYLKDLF